MVARSQPVTVTVQPAHPAFLTAASNGTGLVAALNQDGTYNSAMNPAPKGSIVTLFATGTGLANAAQADGAITPVAPFLTLAAASPVTVGGADAEILFSGAAPLEVAGLTQFNVRIPSTVGTGSLSIQLNVGTFSSPDGVVLFVQ
jgi:uncharacterized protein (TIGR03437 family)